MAQLGHAPQLNMSNHFPVDPPEMKNNQYYLNSKSIAFYAHKGGVGKSTLIFDAAYSLAIHHQQHVVIIDADSQLNTTFKLLHRMEANIDDAFIDSLLGQSGTSANPFPQLQVGLTLPENVVRQVGTLYSYLSGGVPQHPFNAQDLLIVPSTGNHVRFLIGSPILHNLEFQLNNAISNPMNNPATAHVPLLFLQLLNQIKAHYAKNNQSVIILVDMSPSASKINQNLLLSCQYLVLPSTADDNSMVSLRLLFMYLHRWRQDHSSYLPPAHSPKFILAILNRYKIQNVENHQPSQMAQVFYHRMDNMIQQFLNLPVNADFTLPVAARRPWLLNVQDWTRFGTLSSEENISFFEITRGLCNQFHVNWDQDKINSIDHELRALTTNILNRL